MSLAIVKSRALIGVKSPLVTVEVHLSNGLPHFSLVGLPETAVREAKERVRSALLNSRFEFPAHRITVNLAPADLPKEGGRFDLAIAIGILAASAQVPATALAEYEIAGELSLSGELRPICGALPFALAAKKSTPQSTLIFPSDSAREAAMARNITILRADHLLSVCAHLKGEQPLPIVPHTTKSSEKQWSTALEDIKGQHHAKRALAIAAAGKHNILLKGPPGTGKTMLAHRLPALLPPLSEEAALEVAAIYSITAKAAERNDWHQCPFRNPHHTASSPAMVGGGKPPKPGEISLAHHGVLFMDELPEFPRVVLETLRQPLESGSITISRAAHQLEFPAQFQLIAAMNPCPCGQHGSSSALCQCSKQQISRYQNRISGPLLDRFDLLVPLAPVPHEQLTSEMKDTTYSTHAVQQQVMSAQERQMSRCNAFNAHLSAQQVEEFCVIPPEGKKLTQEMLKKFNLSARGYHRVLKVARTIADCEQQDRIQLPHLIEAFGFRLEMSKDF